MTRTAEGVQRVSSRASVRGILGTKSKNAAKKKKSTPKTSKPSKPTKSKAKTSERPSGKKAKTKGGSKGKTKVASKKTTAKKTSAAKGKAKKTKTKPAAKGKATKKSPTKKAPAKAKAKTATKKAATKAKATKAKATKKKATATKKKTAATKKKTAATKKKTATKKTATKKTAAKKTAAKKTAAKKTAATKKSLAKKVPAKKATAGKETAKAATKRRVKSETKSSSRGGKRSEAAKQRARRKALKRRREELGDPEDQTAEDLEDELVEEKGVSATQDLREVLLHEARSAQRQKDFEAAQRHLQRFIEQYPDDVRGLIHLAGLRRAQGDRQGALDGYRGALRKQPDSREALWWKADYHLSEPQLPDLKQAKDALERIVKLSRRRKDPASVEWLGEAQDRLKFCVSRRHSIESRKHLKGRSGRPPTPSALGKARDCLAKALSLYPEDPRNHMNLGSVELQLGHLEEAIEHCRGAIERNASYARAHLILGHALRQAGALRQSRDAYLQCIELDRAQRDSAEAWRARLQVEQELARSRRRFFHALARRPGDDGELEPLDLATFKDWVSVLEGDEIEWADLIREGGGYALQAYGRRGRYRVFPGPEGLVIEH